MDKKLAKSVRLKKRVPMAIKLEGGGGGVTALMAWPLADEFFVQLH